MRAEKCLFLGTIDLNDKSNVQQSKNSWCLLEVILRCLSDLRAVSFKTSADSDCSSYSVELYDSACKCLLQWAFRRLNNVSCLFEAPSNEVHYASEFNIRCPQHFGGPNLLLEDVTIEIGASITEKAK